MGRRRQSTFEDLIDIAAGIPWMWSLGLGVAAYFGFHSLATLPPPSPVPIVPGKMGEAFGHILYRQIAITFGMFLQYLVPLAFLAGAALSAFKQTKS